MTPGDKKEDNHLYAKERGLRRKKTCQDVDF
jgi:hypothetical protein